MACAALFAMAAAVEAKTVKVEMTAVETDVVVDGPREDPKTQALLDAIRRTYVPHRTLVLVDPADPETIAVAPALAEGKEPKDHPVAYVCRGRTCSPPVADATALAAALRA